MAQERDKAYAYLESPAGTIWLVPDGPYLRWDSDDQDLTQVAGRIVPLEKLQESDGNPYAAAVHKLKAVMGGFSRVLYQPPESDDDKPADPAPAGPAPAHESVSVFLAAIESWDESQHHRDHGKFSGTDGGNSHSDFHEWFKGSHAVGQDGQPLMVYHGGPAKDSFDPEHGVKRGGEYGIYLTPRKKYAEAYGNGQASPYHVSLKNPLYVEGKYEISPRNLTKEDVDNLTAKGHDGIVVVNYQDAENKTGADPIWKASEIVAFRNDQVRRPVSGVAAESFNPEQHPRGHEGNPGQFAKGGGHTESPQPHAEPKPATPTSAIRAAAIPDKTAQDEKQARTDAWNSKFNAMVKATGQDYWDAIFKVPANSSHEEQMAWMDHQLAEYNKAAGVDMHATRTIRHRVKRKFDSFCDVAAGSQRISGEQAAEYSKVAGSVLEGMNQKALQRFSENVQAVTLYPSLRKMTDDLLADHHRKIGSGVLGGCWEVADPWENTGPGTLHLDGGRDTGAGGTKLSGEYYAHEFAHAIDRGISDSMEWQKAWNSEILHSDYPLSRYATTDRSEGFAEFGRLIWSGNKTPREIQAKFPQCWAVWEQQGIVNRIPQKVAESFDESKHPRGHEGNPGEFAKKDSGTAAPAHDPEQVKKDTAEFNFMHKSVSRHTGLEFPDILRKFKEMGVDPRDHSARMKALDAIRDAHYGKPYAWEPDDHLNPAKFQAFDWESPEQVQKRKDSWDMRWKVRSKIVHRLAAADALPNSRKKQYMEHIQKVLDYMPVGALKTASLTVRDAQFHNSTIGLTKFLKGSSYEGIIGGAWRHVAGQITGELHLDGGDDIGGNVGGQTAREIYSHEFGHAVDGDPHTGRFRSDGEDWQQAWQEEVNLKHAPLSEYAKTSPSEGWAEFARMAWSGMRPRDIREMYPKCYEVFKKHGLVG